MGKLVYAGTDGLMEINEFSFGTMLAEFGYGLGTFKGASDGMPGGTLLGRSDGYHQMEMKLELK